MSYLAEWKDISIRIKSLISAGHFLAQMLSVNADDSLGSGKYLSEQSGKIYYELETFLNTFSITFPEKAKNSLSSFLQKYKSHFTNSATINAQHFEMAKIRLTLLAAFESELSFLLSDTQEQVHRRSELAFTHLQRSIMVDIEMRKKWKTAFQKNELACEKLGAIHFLYHGIWAFKTDAIGGRTDLVLGEPLKNIDEIERVAEGLVLTEWKKALNESDANKKFNEAREQAKKYINGILAGIELQNYRYVVVVSKNNIGCPQDIKENGIIYRHINISVDPKTPSR